MNSIPKILKTMFAVFFVLQIIFYAKLYANHVDVTKLDHYLDQLEQTDNNVFSVSVSEKGNAVYQRSIGFIDPSFTKRSNIHTKYRIGELSKTFTSVIILQMVDEKMIQLGTPISRFFPDIPNGKHISLKDILSKRVNILNYLPGGKFYKAIKSEFVFNELLKEEELSSGGADEFSLSDPNYLILKMVIEKLEGMPYNDVLKTRITGRIGLTNTFDGSEEEADVWLDGKWDLQSITCSGSIISTPGDLNKFMNALFHEKLLTEKSLKSMTTINNSYGLGLEEIKFGNRIGYGYSGSIDGFVSQTIYFPSDSTCISFSMNLNASSKNAMMDELVKIIYGS